MTSSYVNPQYHYQAVATNENENLDRYIEGDSTEYKWSPHPEDESIGDVQDTPEELYGAGDKKGENFQTGLNTRKRTGTSCQIEIHFMIETTDSRLKSVVETFVFVSKNS